MQQVKACFWESAKEAPETTWFRGVEIVVVARLGFA